MSITTKIEAIRKQLHFDELISKTDFPFISLCTNNLSILSYSDHTESAGGYNFCIKPESVDCKLLINNGLLVQNVELSVNKLGDNYVAELDSITATSQIQTKEVKLRIEKQTENYSLVFPDGALSPNDFFAFVSVQKHPIFDLFLNENFQFTAQFCPEKNCLKKVLCSANDITITIPYFPCSLIINNLDFDVEINQNTALTVSGSFSGVLKFETYQISADINLVNDVLSIAITQKLGELELIQFFISSILSKLMPTGAKIDFSLFEITSLKFDINISSQHLSWLDITLRSSLINLYAIQIENAELRVVVTNPINFEIKNIDLEQSYFKGAIKIDSIGIVDISSSLPFTLDLGLDIDFDFNFDGIDYTIPINFKIPDFGSVVYNIKLPKTVGKVNLPSISWDLALKLLGIKNPFEGIELPSIAIKGFNFELSMVNGCFQILRFDFSFDANFEALNISLPLNISQPSLNGDLSVKLNLPDPVGAFDFPIIPWFFALKLLGIKNPFEGIELPSVAIKGFNFELSMVNGCFQMPRFDFSFDANFEGNNVYLPLNINQVDFEDFTIKLNVPEPIADFISPALPWDFVLNLFGIKNPFGWIEECSITLTKLDFVFKRHNPFQCDFSFNASLLIPDISLAVKCIDVDASYNFSSLKFEFNEFECHIKNDLLAPSWLKFALSFHDFDSPRLSLLNAVELSLNTIHNLFTSINLCNIFPTPLPFPTIKIDPTVSFQKLSIDLKDWKFNRICIGAIIPDWTLCTINSYPLALTDAKFHVDISFPQVGNITIGKASFIEGGFMIGKAVLPTLRLKFPIVTPLLELCLPNLDEFPDFSKAFDLFSIMGISLPYSFNLDWIEPYKIRFFKFDFDINFEEPSFTNLNLCLSLPNITFGVFDVALPFVTFRMLDTELKNIELFLPLRFGDVKVPVLGSLDLSASIISPNIDLSYKIPEYALELPEWNNFQLDPICLSAFLDTLIEVKPLFGGLDLSLFQTLKIQLFDLFFALKFKENTFSLNALKLNFGTTEFIPFIPRLIEIKFIPTTEKESVTLTSKNGSYELSGSIYADIRFLQPRRSDAIPIKLTFGENNLWKFGLRLNKKEKGIKNFNISSIVPMLEGTPALFGSLTDLVLTSANMTYLFQEGNYNAKNIRNFEFVLEQEQNKEIEILPSVLSLSNVKSNLAVCQPFNDAMEITANATFTAKLMGGFQVHLHLEYPYPEKKLKEEYPLLTNHTIYGLSLVQNNSIVPTDILQSLLRLTGLSAIMNALPINALSAPSICLNKLLLLAEKDEDVGLQNFGESVLKILADISVPNTLPIIPQILSIKDTNVSLGISNPFMEDMRTIFGNASTIVVFGTKAMVRVTLYSPDKENYWKFEVSRTEEDFPEPDDVYLKMSSFTGMLHMLGGGTIAKSLPSGLNTVQEFRLDKFILHIPDRGQNPFKSIQDSEFLHATIGLKKWSVIQELVSLSNIKIESKIDDPFKSYSYLEELSVKAQLCIDNVEQLKLKASINQYSFSWDLELDNKEVISINGKEKEVVTPVFLPNFDTITNMVHNINFLKKLPSGLKKIPNCELSHLVARFTPRLEHLNEISLALNTTIDEKWEVIQQCLYLKDIYANLVVTNPLNEATITGQLNGKFSLFNCKPDFNFSLEVSPKDEWLIVCDCSNLEAEISFSQLAEFIHSSTLDSVLPYYIDKWGLKLKYFEIEFKTSDLSLNYCKFIADLDAEMSISIPWGIGEGIPPTSIGLIPSSLVFTLGRDKKWDIIIADCKIELRNLPFIGNNLPSAYLDVFINEKRLLIKGNDLNIKSKPFRGLNLPFINCAKDLTVECHSIIYEYVYGSTPLLQLPFSLIGQSDIIQTLTGFDLLKNKLEFILQFAHNGNLEVQLTEYPFKMGEHKEENDWQIVSLNHQPLFKFQLPSFRYNGNLFKITGKFVRLDGGNKNINIEWLKNTIAKVSAKELVKFIPNEIGAQSLETKAQQYGLSKEDLPEVITNTYWNSSIPQEAEFSFHTDNENILFSLEFFKNNFKTNANLIFINEEGTIQTAVSVHKIALGTICNLYRLEIDGQAAILSLEAFKALKLIQNPVFDTGSPWANIVLDNVVAVMAGGFPIPVAFDLMSAKVNTIGDMMVSANTTLSRPQINGITKAAELALAVSQLVDLAINGGNQEIELTNVNGEKPFVLQLSVDMRTPSIFGGHEQSIYKEQIDVGDSVIHFFKACRNLDISELIQVIPKAKRELTSKALAIGPIRTPSTKIKVLSETEYAKDNKKHNFPVSDGITTLLNNKKGIIVNAQSNWVVLSNVCDLSVNVGTFLSTSFIDIDNFIHLKGKLSDLFMFELKGALGLSLAEKACSNPWITNADWGLYIQGTRIMHCSAEINFAEQCIDLNGSLSLFNSNLLQLVSSDKLTGKLQNPNQGPFFSLKGEIKNSGLLKMPISSIAITENSIQVEVPNITTLKHVWLGEEFGLEGIITLCIKNIEASAFILPNVIEGMPLSWEPTVTLEFSPTVKVSIGNSFKLGISGILTVGSMKMDFPEFPPATIGNSVRSLYPSHIENYIRTLIFNNTKEILYELVGSMANLLAACVGSLTRFGFSIGEFKTIDSQKTEFSGSLKFDKIEGLKIEASINGVLFIEVTNGKPQFAKLIKLEGSISTLSVGSINLQSGEINLNNNGNLQINASNSIFEISIVTNNFENYGDKNFNPEKLEFTISKLVIKLTLNAESPHHQLKVDLGFWKYKSGSISSYFPFTPECILSTSNGIKASKSITSGNISTEFELRTHFTLNFLFPIKSLEDIKPSNFTHTIQNKLQEAVNLIALNSFRQLINEAIHSLSNHNLDNYITLYRSEKRWGNKRVKKCMSWITKTFSYFVNVPYQVINPLLAVKDNFLRTLQSSLNQVNKTINNLEESLKSHKK